MTYNKKDRQKMATKRKNDETWYELFHEAYRDQKQKRIQNDRYADTKTKPLTKTEK